MKFVLTRHVNEEVVHTGKYNNYGDAYDGMKQCLMNYEGAFDKTKFYNKYFTGKSFKDDDYFIIFPNEWDTEGADYFMLKKLEEQPATGKSARKRPPEEAAEEGERAEYKGDLQPIRWTKQPEEFVGPFACIMAMSKAAFDKYLAQRANSARDYSQFAKEVAERKGQGVDLSRFKELTQQIVGCEAGYTADVRTFLHYMVQSDKLLNDDAALFNLDDLCAHTPANKVRVTMLVLEVAVCQAFELPDFSVHDLAFVGRLLSRMCALQRELDDTVPYTTDELDKYLLVMDPAFFLDVCFAEYLDVLVDVVGVDILWQALPIHEEFTVAKLEILERLRREKDLNVMQFLHQLDSKRYSNAQLQFYAFDGEESPNEGCFNLLFNFFTEKGDSVEAQRVAAAKSAKFPELAPTQPYAAV